jgi:hypothetical protein
MAAMRMDVRGTIVFIALSMLLMFGLAALADEPTPANGQLQPIPHQTAPDAVVPEPSQETALHPNGAVPDDNGQCEDFCGMPCCSLPGRFWLRGDYLMWWTSGMRLPPLVTTSPQGTSSADAGVLGLPTTKILFGDERVFDNGRSGFRTTMGFWLDNCHAWGVEVDYFELGGESRDYASGYSNGLPILARPIYNTQTIAQSRELVAYPKEVAGEVTVGTKDFFRSAGVDLSYNLCCCDSCDPCADNCCPTMLFCCRTDLLIGYRHYRLNDSVRVHENLRSLSEPTEDWLYDIKDSFRARNDFQGSELGLRTQIHRGCWSVDFLVKVALGINRQEVLIDGQTIITPPDQPVQVRDGGVFAVRSNEGLYKRDVFTVIPQLGVDFSYQLNCNWRAFLGYNVLYWGCVARSADQIDLNVDPRNIPNVQDPALPFPAYPGKTTCFWAHGVNVGLEFRF